ncbi:NAD(P)-dependent alcohol dehydrogenase [Flammeovirga agarivorans]|uniref:NAD(P)-dependent alcohol dehydrogenase n=1 Tax=Flammeovirga agarivorans TaxID=2726742 RepID=A0A7X8SJP6_9BACT|nr:NAD(P)-dependent alcohol dehydrogenase [Flammeovirga agarivorans]NLR91461.1 NAD(P)-dependent alcohol dehydrogenase [Flammeovirga agarivorans]
MKQVVYNQYGNSDVLKVEHKDRPALKRRNSMLIKVSYSSLNAIDWKNRKGHFKLFTGLFKPKTKQGFDVVGIIEDKSKDVSEFSIGDQVIGQLGNFDGGALSEYLVVNTKEFVKIPKGIQLNQAAGIPMAGTTAWMALMELGNLKKGDKVLINGGSSGVGHFAIQIAKAYGAHVTSVSSSKNLTFCTQMGADTVISYQEENFLDKEAQFDIIFDVVFNSSYKKTKHLLGTNGIYIGTTPSKTMVFELLRYQKAKFVAVQPNKNALQSLIHLMEENKLKVNIDKEYLLDDIIPAHQYLEKSRTKGKVIIKIAK